MRLVSLPLIYNYCTCHKLLPPFHLSTYKPTAASISATSSSPPSSCSTSSITLIRRLHIMDHCCTTVTNTNTNPAAATICRHRRRDIIIHNNNSTNNNNNKVLVIMGATGSGKSRLSIDLATRFPSEIINSDKMQVYGGLNITTNKMPIHERMGVPHHLLGDVDSSLGEFTPPMYRSRASSLISAIVSRRRLPLIVGGSNSFIYALLADQFDPQSDVFLDPDQSAVCCSQPRYNCCFLWVDVSLPVLNEYLVKRVDEMLDSGMVEELAQYYESEIHESKANTGLRKAIGVPEFERYFKMMMRVEKGARESSDEVDSLRSIVYEEAVRAIKDNTCQLAKRQVEKILRLRNAGWELQKLDATEAFKAVMDGDEDWAGIWERQVLEPSLKIVKHFLEE